MDHTATGNDPGWLDLTLGERFVRICRMTDERLRQMDPAERDRMMQVHLAAARGPQRNYRLLCEMTDMLAPIRREHLAAERRATEAEST